MHYDIPHPNFVSPELFAFLRACVDARLNIIIAGGTQTGQASSLLGALAEVIPIDRRAAALQLPGATPVAHGETLSLQREFQGRELIRQALRMRPEHLLIDPLHDDDIHELFQAMFSGQQGLLATIEAESPEDVLAHLETICRATDPSMFPQVYRGWISLSLEFIAQITELEDGTFRLTRLAEVRDVVGDKIELVDIFTFTQTGIEAGKVVGKTRPTGLRPNALSRIEYQIDGLPHPSLAEVELAIEPDDPLAEMGLTQTYASQIEQLAAALQDFSLNLFNGIAEAEAGQNVFVSPFSIALALLMLYRGAQGQTREEITRLLALPDLLPDDLDHAAAALRIDLHQPGGETLVSIANSLWLNQISARDDPELSPDYLQSCERFYRAAITPLDFEDPAAPAEINAWVYRKTGGHIPAILDALDPAQALVLANAVYFRGRWGFPFSPRSTQDGEFTLPDDSKKTLPMMSRRDLKLPYYRGEDFQAVELYYADGRTRMTILLPDDHTGLPALQQQLTSQRWQTWLAALTSTKLDLTMPRFTLDYTLDLSSALAGLGLGIAFDPAAADFGGMLSGEGRLWLGQAVHKATLKVDERGTIATAATAAPTLFGLAGPPPVKIEVVVDRPFICVIRDTQSGTILFAGAVNEPM